MELVRRIGDDSSEVNFTRTDRFVTSEEGYYYRTREGLMGPYENLSLALLGLIENAKKSKMPQYQINQLYKSMCEKVLSSC